MLAYIATRGCREEHLRRCLDDEAARPCGRCDNCTAVRRSAAVEPVALDAARARLRRPGVEIEPRKQWPSGLADGGLTGRVKAELGAEPGRALGRLTDLGWGSRLRALFHDETEDGPVSDEVFAAVVKVLAAWGWAERPTAVVSLPSGRRPQLIESLAARIGGVGRLPHLGALAYRSGSPGTHFNSAKRVQAIRGTLVLPRALAALVAEASGPILLVDDRVDSGWTMTIAAALLRRAGAGKVLPLALAITS
jgi:ATP-dependent DNA helicase RecQ